MFRQLIDHRIGMLLFCAPLAACIGFGDPGAPKLSALAQRGGATLAPVATGALQGLSDLTTTANDDGSLTLWALPEQQRFLAPLDAGQPTRPYLLPGARPIRDIDDAYDTESVTSLGAGRFAVGTETMEAGRASDIIFVLAGDSNASGAGGVQSAQPLVVAQAIAMPYALWPGFRASGNEGIEGLCHAGGQLLASSESPGRLADGSRFAPLGLYDMVRDTWRPMALALTLPTGRIAALQCRIVPERPEFIEVLAIERHFGVGRLLHAWVPRHVSGAPPAEVLRITPTVLADLSQLLQPIVNFEGAAWLPSGRVALVTDNHMMCVRGETYLLTLPEGGIEPGP